MRSPFAFLRRLSLRVRITVSFAAAAALLTVLLATATFISVQTVLERQRVHSNTRQTVFVLLFARQFLELNPDQSQQLVSLLQSRERFDAIVTEGVEWFSTQLNLTPGAIPEDLHALVADEKVGYQFADFAGQPVLVYGAPLPPRNTNLYLFYPLQDIGNTMSLLAKALLAVGVAVTLVAVLLALRVSKRILRPLAGVSEAAQRVAEGLLETRVQASGRDEVGMLAASFNQMAGAFQEMIQRERRFVAAVSHELRTPLAALQATSEVLAGQRSDLSPSAREAADLVLEDVVDLRRLIEDLLEVSELDSRRAAVRYEPVDLQALAEAVVRRRRLDVAVDGPHVVTAADKARTERILGNLVDNALQHAEASGVRISVRSMDGVCDVAVQDRGPGIAAEDLPHLFERFYKADRSRSRGVGGIGLGLAIAMQNARLMGGTILVQSEEGRGSTFTLRLPLRVSEEVGT